jgi:hypothetical protein
MQPEPPGRLGYSWASSAGICCGGAVTRSLEAFVFLGGGKAGDVVATGGALGTHASQGLVLCPGFPEDDHGAKGLGVHAGNQVGVAGAVLFPELANLNL